MPILYRDARVDAPDVSGATAFEVDGPTVSWIGDDDGATDRLSTNTTVVDLGGALVTPAFVDAHVHATSTGLALTALDLRHATSVHDVLDAVGRATRTARGRPVLGGGWDESSWLEPRPPTAAELDRASFGSAVYLARVDVHSAVVSSSLMAAVPGLAGMVGYAAAGWQRGAAHDAVRAVALAALSPAQRVTAQRAALRHAASLGIACVHEMAGPVVSSEDDLTGLFRLVADEPLPEVIGYWGELFGIEAARDLGATGAGGDLFCDGSLGSHTAALSEPYADRPDTRGLLRFATADVAEHIERCAAAGLQAGFHAIGDAAVDQVLDAVESLSDRLGRPGRGRPGRPTGRPHRIEHAEFVRDPGRLAASGLVASVQPCFDALWGGAYGMYAERLEGRAAMLNRFADLAAAGVPLAFGSDAPVTELGPWASVRAAANPSDPQTAISVRAAFTAHTRGGWHAAGRGTEGILAPGRPATFAIWQSAAPVRDGLPTVRAGDALPDCLATVHRGVTLFDSGLLAS